MGDIQWGTLIPILIYFILMYVIGFYASSLNKKASLKKGSTGDAYIGEHLTGGRDTGGFVLAMTMVATYLSAGSFIGGPGTAYTHGLAWVFLAMAQMPTGYFTLSVLGKKFAIISRKVNANSITDFLKARYNSHTVYIIASLSIVFFLTAAMAAQLIGAARLLQGSTGLTYTTSLLFFAITVIVHTAVGGFKGVTLNDTLQGVVMTISTMALLVMTIVKGGGVANMIQTMKGINPGTISPYGVTEGFMTIPWVTSFWILVGFAVVGLPAISQRAMSYKDTKSLKAGIKYGTVVSLVLLLGMHMVGALGITLVSGIESGDLVVPTLSTMLFSPVLAGIILAGPLAAVMSTLDSQLLVVVGSIVSDLTVNYIKPDLKHDMKKTRILFNVGTFVVGAIIIYIAMDPPELMVWLNLFASAGQISTFLWPTILGLYWKRANKQGAIASMVSGIGVYMFCNYFWPRPFGFHPITLSVAVSLLGFVAVTYMFEKPSDELVEKFWGI